MAYIDVPIDTQPVDLAEEAYTYLQDTVDGWLPSPGNLEAWLIEALAQIASELRTLIGFVPDVIFEYFGESILGLAPYGATQASALSTWSMLDAAGYSVEAGALVAVTPPASTDTYAFSVEQGFTVPPGQLTAINVSLVAVEAGVAANGISGAVEVLDPLDFVANVVLDAPTSGGQDAEAPDQYLNRLSDLVTLLAPRPILPQDFAVLAQRSVPGVARAVAIDLYNPGPPVNAACPRCVTIVLVDAAGNPVSATIKQQVDALLQSEREVNFLVFVADPTYTTIDVTFDLMSYPGYDPVQVRDYVISALQLYLSPQGWGVPPFGDTSARSWINETSVRYLEVAEQINRVEGVHYIKTLTLGQSGGAQSNANIALTGVAPLPHPGAITGTVAAET